MICHDFSCYRVEPHFGNTDPDAFFKDCGQSPATCADMFQKIFINSRHVLSRRHKDLLLKPLSLDPHGHVVRDRQNTSLLIDIMDVYKFAAGTNGCALAMLPKFVFPVKHPGTGTGVIVSLLIEGGVWNLGAAELPTEAHFGEGFFMKPMNL